MADNKSRKETEEHIEKKAKKITAEDIQKVLEKEQEIKNKVKAGGPLREYIDAIKSMFALIKAYWSGEYREVPWLIVAAIVVTLLYVFSPVDLIPDAIPVVGLLDDATVVGACLNLVKKDLATFEEWRAAKENEETLA